ASRRHGPEPTDLIQRRTDIRHGGADTRQQQLAVFGARYAARGAVNQANAKPLFHVAEPLAEAGHRDALLGRGPAEIPRARHGDASIENAASENLSYFTS